ncbi:MAG: mechanosensitive ion channel family protein [Candidatus Krumholzibacteria bacterium]|nr:mechanosensitive ion channel family protein [Candidatus Krumholzibacteria bacterium]
MEWLTGIDGIYRDIAVVAAEIALLVVVFIVLNGIIRAIFGRLEYIPALKKHKDRAQIIRRRLKRMLVVLCLVLSAGAVAINGYLVYQKKDVFEHTRGWIARLPEGFWIRLGVDAAKVMGIAIAAAIIVRVIRRVLTSLMKRAKAWEQVRANDESIEAFFDALIRISKNSIWLLVLILAAGVLSLPSVVSRYLLIILKIYLIISLGMLIVSAVMAIVQSLAALREKYKHRENFLAWYDQLSGLIPLLTRCLEYIIYVTVASLVVLQVDFIAQFAVYGPRIVQIIGIFFLARVVVEIANLVIARWTRTGEEQTAAAVQQRRTIAPALNSLLRYVIYFVAFVLVLRAIRLDPTPILAGAGIIGLVVGLGAQSLINDFLSGFFILSEQLFMVGDYIETGSSRGVVEAIEIRTTRIRDPNGQLHILRNGQIGEIVNFSKEYTFAVVEVGVAYDSNLEDVYRVLGETGERLKAQTGDVLEPTRVQGLKNFGESDLVIRTLTKVRPGTHRQVARQMRKLIKEAFDREGIEIPFARRVLIFDREKNKDGGQSIEGV